MKYQYVTLDGSARNFFYAEYPADPEKGSFLEVTEDLDRIRVRVDRFSTIPFYYAVHENKLYGSTKLHLLIQALPASFPRKLNYPAAIEFLRTNSMIASKTLMAGVERVPYGHELIFDKQCSQIRLHEYWRLAGDIILYDENDLIANLSETFQRVVKTYVSRVERVGMQLSGGMDSRQIIATLKKLEIPFKAFTYGVPQNIDVLIAQQLAKKFGIPHNFDEWNGAACFRNNFDDQFIMTDGMQALFHGHGIATYLQEACCVDTVIYGHFLDLFIQAHSYDSYFEKDYGLFTVKHLYEKFDGGVCSVMRGDSIEHDMLENEWHGVYAANIYSEIRKFDYMIPEKRYDALYFVHHGLRRLLPQVQAGAHSVDFFLPGLDRDYFDLSWSVPGSLRSHRELQKKLLKTICVDVLCVPVVRDNCQIEFLGSSSIDKWKSMYHQFMNKHYGGNTYMYDYYGTGLPQMVNDQLYLWIKGLVTSSALNGLGLIKQEYIDELFRHDQLHKQVSLGHYGALITLCRFVDTYID